MVGISKLQRAKDAIKVVFEDYEGKAQDDTYAELEELKEEIESCQAALNGE